MEYKKLSTNALTPTRATDQAAGYDLYSNMRYIIPPRNKCLIFTDIMLQIPIGYYGRIAPRSGLANKYSIDVGGGVIDSDYRGNIGVILFNHSEDAFYINKHDKIAQIIITKIITPELIEINTVEETTQRGDKGFGSSDIVDHIV